MFKRLSKNHPPTQGLRPGNKVFVGVSGGVDSSVCAALLKDEGYDVVGVFIRTWQPDFIECTWRDERRDAMRVCAHLGIPFVELDMEREYKEGVADYMISEYRAGRTPNPDVMCNREVKFGGFLKWALAHGADYIATGHYAQIKASSRLRAIPSFAELASKKGASGDNEDIFLLKGVDPSKDQSYFLWTLTNEQLQHILFPIGHLQKSDVRKLAEKYRLPTATKKDSQGICFIGDVDMKDFLSHYIRKSEGSVLNESGKVVGTHDGALMYTRGERHGFVISSKGTNDLPYYVIAKDIAANTITVSQHPLAHDVSKQIILTDCVWRQPPLLEGVPKAGVSAQIRYHGEQKPCVIEKKSDSEYCVIFDSGDFSLSPGQSVVVYEGDVCIGGGIVK